MKKYEIIKISEMWSTNTLRKNVESLINKKSNDGYEIITVACKSMVDANGLYHNL